MDHNNPVSKSFPQQREILHKQIGDLRLSLRSSEAQAISSEIPIDEKLGQFIDQTVVGVYHSTVDGQLVMANAALARIFGFDSPEEMMESVTDIGKQLYVDPGQRTAWCKLLWDNKTVGPVLWHGHRTDHELLYLEEYARVIHDNQGRIWGYEGIVLDVTTRYPQELLSEGVGKNSKILGKADVITGVQTHEQLLGELADAHQMIATLREQLDRYEIATKGSQEGLWEAHPLPNQPWDSPETPAWYSPQFIALLGFEEQEFPPIEASWASRIHPEDRERVFQALRDHIEHHVPYEVESRLKTKQGEYRWFKAKGQAIFDEQGKFVRGGGTIRDITTQKETEEAVKKKACVITSGRGGDKRYHFCQGS